MSCGNYLKYELEEVVGKDDEEVIDESLAFINDVISIFNLKDFVIYDFDYVVNFEDNYWIKIKIIGYDKDDKVVKKEMCFKIEFDMKSKKYFVNKSEVEVDNG